MRQKIRHLIKNIDPEIRIINTHVHMHSADQHAANHTLQVTGKHLIAFFVGMTLFGPVGKWVRRGCNRCQIVLIGNVEAETNFLYEFARRQSIEN